MSTTYPPATLPDWIVNEKLLRDEAVLFGLSEARPDEKLATIQLAFTAQTAPLEKQLEQGHKAVGTLTALLEGGRQELATLSGQPADVPRPPLLWALLGVGLSGGLSAALAFWLQQLAAPLPSVPAALVALSGCVGTLLLLDRHYRARLAYHQQQATLQQAARRTLQQQLTGWHCQQREQVQALYDLEARLAQFNALRDQRLSLFESEYDLTRSLRDRIGSRFVYHE